MAPLQQELDLAARAFTLKPIAGSNGNYKVQLAPQGTGTGLPSISLSQGTEMVLKESQIDLGFLAKQVRFETPDLGHLGLIGGMPIVDPEPLAATGLTSFLDQVKRVTQGPIENPPGTPAPGVPGLLGKLAGTVQIPMEIEKAAAQVVPTFEARLTLTDEQGNEVGGVTWGGAASPTSAGQAVLAADKLLDEATCTITALTRELGSPDPLLMRYVRAEVKASLNGVTSGWVPIAPPVPVPVPSLPVPSMLVCFRFLLSGNCFVVLPPNSAIDVPGDVTAARANVLGAIDALVTAAQALGVALPAGPVLLGGLVDLKNAINGAAGVRVIKGNQPNLNDITLVENNWLNNNMEAEDELSSFLMIGYQGRTVRLFNARGFADYEGQMNVTVPSGLFVKCQSTDSKSPSSEPGGAISVVRTPGKGGVWPLEYERTFHNEVSSIDWP